MHPMPPKVPRRSSFHSFASDKETHNHDGRPAMLPATRYQQRIHLQRKIFMLLTGNTIGQRHHRQKSQCSAAADERALLFRNFIVDNPPCQVVHHILEALY